ncbi:MAG: hypothetical protein HY244_06835 [Rhizobiales bacterium]|nr:hypothetical protein [Hyphomicrobiales bacterium]
MLKIAMVLTALALGFVAIQPAAAAPGDQRQELSAQSRPRVTIYPRHRKLGPNAKRHCRFWLAQEYRVSGTVIVPRQRCRWQ